MQAKQYLRQAYRLNERIMDKQERLLNLKSMMYGMGAVDYSKERVQGGCGNNAPFENIVIKILDMEAELQADIKNLCQLQMEISQAIDNVTDVNCHLLLSKRYLLRKSWEQISEEMGYSLPQIYRLHKRALSVFKVPKKDDSK